MRRLDLRDIMREPGAELIERVDEELDDLDDLVLTSPARGEVRATNSRRHVIIAGTVATVARLQCSRCLRLFDWAVEGAEVEALCELDYFEALLNRQPVEVEEEVTDIFDATSADLAELIRQAVLLQLPLQPLCDPACKGLCPGCGRDLNHEPCECPPQAMDPRWAQLAVLLQRQPKEDDS